MRLTQAEEEVMLILWDLGEAVVRDIIGKLEDPDTPYTTVSTVVRILEKKGFVSHRVIGNTHLYYPSITKTEYLNTYLPGILQKYFNGSFTEMASFFARENDLSLKEISELIGMVEEEMDEIKENKKKDGLFKKR